MVPACWRLDCVGTMARSARDIALILRVIAGHDPLDVTSSSAPVPDFPQRLGLRLDGVRFGLVRQMYELTGIADDVRAVIDDATVVLEQLGGTVTLVDLPELAMTEAAYPAAVLPEIAAAHRHRLVNAYADLDQNTRTLLAAGAAVPPGVQRRAQRLCGLIAHRLRRTFGEFDILIGATTHGGAHPREVPKSGTSHTTDSVIAPRGLGGLAQRRSFSLAGVPALSTPCGFDREGMPLGLHVASARFEDATILRAAHAFQDATTWADERPVAYRGDIGGREATA
jgi:aspartyl-tRNA(Asn)/glutamyl-tRNA(Gln) amidotransferase subunit A